MSEELKPCPCCGGTKSLFFYDYPTGAFTVCCANCGMRGPATGYSKDGAIAAWNALPRRLRWTKEKPTKTGFYWWCDKKFVDLTASLVGLTASIVAVDVENRESIIIGAEKVVDFTKVGGEWAGPIPEPEDVK